MANNAPVSIRLHITAERLDELSWDDQIAIQEIAAGEARERQFKELIARFVVDTSGAYVPEARARAMLGKLKRPQAREVARQFWNQIGALAVNPTNASD